MQHDSIILSAYLAFTFTPCNRNNISNSNDISSSQLPNLRAYLAFTLKQVQQQQQQIIPRLNPYAQQQQQQHHGIPRNIVHSPSKEQTEQQQHDSIILGAHFAFTFTSATATPSVAHIFPICEPTSTFTAATTTATETTQSRTCSPATSTKITSAATALSGILVQSCFVSYIFFFRLSNSKPNVLPVHPILLPICCKRKYSLHFCQKQEI